MAARKVEMESQLAELALKEKQIELALEERQIASRLARLAKAEAATKQTERGKQRPPMPEQPSDEQPLLPSSVSDQKAAPKAYGRDVTYRILNFAEMLQVAPEDVAAVMATNHMSVEDLDKTEILKFGVPMPVSDFIRAGVMALETERLTQNSAAASSAGASSQSSHEQQQRVPVTRGASQNGGVRHQAHCHAMRQIYTTRTPPGPSAGNLLGWFFTKFSPSDGSANAQLWARAQQGEVAEGVFVLRLMQLWLDQNERKWRDSTEYQSAHDDFLLEHC